MIGVRAGKRTVYSTGPLSLTHQYSPYVPTILRRCFVANKALPKLSRMRGKTVTLTLVPVLLKKTSCIYRSVYVLGTPCMFTQHI